MDRTARIVRPSETQVLAALLPAAASERTSGRRGQSFTLDLGAYSCHAFRPRTVLRAARIDCPLHVHR